MLPNLEYMKFEPYCPNCLKIDDSFNDIKIEGRCLEKKRDDLESIIHEIAGIIYLLIFMSVLYCIRFIRKEIFRFLKIKF